METRHLSALPLLRLADAVQRRKLQLLNAALATYYLASPHKRRYRKLPTYPWLEAGLL